MTGQGCSIRFLPTRPEELASPLGNRADTEFSSSRGVPTPLQATITTSAGWKCSAPVGVVVDRAGRHAVLVGGDLAHPAARAQLDAGADRQRPVGDVGAGLGALRAARRAVAEVDALRAALVGCGGDGGVGRPPVPAELVHRPGIARAGLAERDRRHRRMARRHAGIAGEAGRRPSCGRSPRRSARASSSRSASRRRRRRATSP